MPRAVEPIETSEPSFQSADVLLMNITRWPPHATTLRESKVGEEIFRQLRRRALPRPTDEGTEAGSFAFYAWGRAWQVGVSFRRDGAEQVVAIEAEDLPPVPMS